MGKSGKGDFSKLAVMLVQLKSIKGEMMEGMEEEDNKKMEELKGMDDFNRRKYELTQQLKTIRDDVRKLQDIRKEVGKNSKDTASIRLESNNTKNINRASALWRDLQQALMKEEKKRGKKALSETELDDRRKTTTLLGKEICDLAEKNSSVKTSKNQIELGMESRAKTRNQKQREERALGKKERRKKNKKKIDVDVEDGLREVNMSATEQAFMDQVIVNVEEQDEMLDDIAKGLEELKQLGTDMNKNLQLQGELIGEIDTKMDQTLFKMESAHSRLQDVLKESGGLTRWCPLLVCIILLLALVGYIFNMVDDGVI